MRAFLLTCLLVVPSSAEPLPSWVAGWWRVVGKGPEADKAVLVQSELISTLHGNGKFLEQKLAAPLHCDEHRCTGALPYFDERPIPIAMTRNGEGVLYGHVSPSDEQQHWVRDEKYTTAIDVKYRVPVPADACKRATACCLARFPGMSCNSFDETRAATLRNCHYVNEWVVEELVKKHEPVPDACR